MRVHQLAKELNVPSKLLLSKLHEFRVDAKSHMSVLEDVSVELMRAIDFSAIEEEPAPPSPPPIPAPAPVKEPGTETPTVTASQDADASPPLPVSPAATLPPPAPPVPFAAAPLESVPQKKTASKPASHAISPPESLSAVSHPDEVPVDTLKPQVETPADADDGSEKLVKIRGGIVVRDLARMINIRPNRIVAELMSMNVFANITAKLDFDVATAIAEKFGFSVEHEKRGDAPLPPPHQRDDEPYQDRPEDLRPRPPVVAFLGHVDHGKTSLLDSIRNAAVAKGESGGITQHIGAYTIDMGGKPITFLDTPGHAAFTAMRARGANLTDIAVIIIAADDGIMPQTREAIAHAKAAEVAIVVAINKCDLPGANPDRVLQHLQSEGLAPEEWGGTTICCKVSAMTGEGVEHFLEMILLQAEMLELTANPDKRAHGYVIEAQLEPGKGPTANLLVTEGTLTVGDAILCGPYWGRVRALLNDHGSQVKSAKPSTPVKCLGLSGVPEAGAEFMVLTSDKKARELAAATAMNLKQTTLEGPKKASLDDLFNQLKPAENLDLGVIIKGDTQGSVEAIVHALKGINSEKVSLRFVHSGTGNITANDVLLASASRAVVLGFHVARESGVDALAKHEGVEIRLHQIIYELLDQVRDAMIGVLGPRLEEMKRGQAQVRQIFEIGKGSQIGGCLVLKGIINAKHRVRVKRKAEVLFEGTIQSLKHFQDDVPEVREAQECGIRIQHFSDLQEGDIIEAYEIEEREQTL